MDMAKCVAHTSCLSCTCNTTGMTGWQLWVLLVGCWFFFTVAKALIRAGWFNTEQPGSDCRIVKEMLRVTPFFILPVFSIIFMGVSLVSLGSGG